MKITNRYEVRESIAMQTISTHKTFEAAWKKLCKLPNIAAEIKDHQTGEVTK